MTFGMLVGSVIFGPIVDRFGYKPLLIFCSAVILISLEGLAFAPSLHIVKISLLLIGFGGGVINGGSNALVADIAEEGKSADLSLLGVFFGLGAFGMPFLLGMLLDSLSYETIIASIGGMVLLPLVFFVLISFPKPKLKQGFPLREGVGLLRNPMLVLLGVVLFFESGMEITTGGWVSSFFHREFDIPTEKAVFLLSFYWLGMLFARIILNNLLKKISPKRILLWSIGIAFAGSITLILTNSVTVAAIGVVVLGVGFAAVYPVILGYVGDMYPDLSGTAFSIVLAMALIGGMSIPYLTGISGNYLGLRLSFSIISICLVCMAVLFYVFVTHELRK